MILVLTIIQEQGHEIIKMENGELTDGNLYDNFKYDEAKNQSVIDLMSKINDIVKEE